MVYRVTVVRRFSCIVFDFIDREEKENKKKKKPVSRLFSVDFFFFFLLCFQCKVRANEATHVHHVCGEYHRLSLRV